MFSSRPALSHSSSAARDAATPPTQDDNNVEVYVRCRPVSDTERSHKRNVVVSFPHDARIGIEMGRKNLEFSYSGVFDVNTTQHAIFSTAALKIVREFLSGYSCTIFAYGQTGTGKTFTMEGGLASAEKEGVIPRCLRTIFDRVKAKPSVDTKVHVSCVEIYNEVITDLADGKKKEAVSSASVKGVGSATARVRGGEGSAGSVAMDVKGLKEVEVTSTEEAMSFLQRCSRNRQTRETIHNKRSSRSHAIFTIYLTQRPANVRGKQSFQLIRSKLNLVDLAGSERASKASSASLLIDKKHRHLTLSQVEAADSVHGRETANINKSLLCLGRVIQALSSSSGMHVPYRESTLTRLLADSLGGTTKTLLIATIGPCENTAAETKRTLEYASSAKGIKNTPVMTYLSDPKKRDEKKVFKKKKMEKLELLHYKKVLATDPSNAGVINNYAMALLHRSDGDADIDEVEELFERGLEYSPHHAELASNYALFLARNRRDFIRARSVFEQAVESNPRHSKLLSNYALFLKNILKEYDMAAMMLAKALAADPANADVLTNFAVFLETVRKDYVSAESHHLRAVELAPNNHRVLNNYAVFLKNIAQDFSQADEYFSRALHAAVKDTKAAADIARNYHNFAKYYLRDEGKAERILKESVQLPKLK